MSTALAIVPNTAAAEAKLAPHNIELERALLGVILVHNEAFDRVSDVLQPEHFYEGVHRRIFEVITTLLRSGKIATPITLKMFLADLDLGGMTVPQYLSRLAAEATTVINAVEYAARSVIWRCVATSSLSARRSPPSPTTRRQMSRPATRSRMRSASSMRWPKAASSRAASSASTRP